MMIYNTLLIIDDNKCCINVNNDVIVGTRTYRFERPRTVQYSVVLTLDTYVSSSHLSLSVTTQHKLCSSISCIYCSAVLHGFCVVLCCVVLCCSVYDTFLLIGWNTYCILELHGKIWL